jgi:hypothetical protein
MEATSVNKAIARTDHSRVEFSNAPGLKRRERANGTVAFYWVASAVSRQAKNYPLKAVRVHGDEYMIAHRCRVLTDELREWLDNRGQGSKPIYDGTLKSLIAVYRRTPESPYHSIKHNTRRMYDESLDLLESIAGARRLSKLTGLDFRRWYNELKAPADHTEREIVVAEKAGEPLQPKPERVRRAFKAMQLLRIIIKFGIVANITDCFRLNAVLDAMEFSSPPARTSFITFEQVKAFCDHAIKIGRVSMAQAQALQFELTLRQADVIGQWEPSDGRGGGIIDRGQQWSGGVAWNHIDSDGILRKETTKQLDPNTIHVAEHDTNAYPFLRSMLDLTPVEKRFGPIVIDEGSKLPYRRRHFARIWRQIANDVGIPITVWNRDSRAGGVTEGSDAGADIEHLRHHATHSNIATTGRYNRPTLKKTRNVAQLRVASRHDKNA